MAGYSIAFQHPPHPAVPRVRKDPVFFLRSIPLSFLLCLVRHARARHWCAPRCAALADAMGLARVRRQQREVATPLRHSHDNQPSHDLPAQRPYATRSKTPSQRGNEPSNGGSHSWDETTQGDEQGAWHGTRVGEAWHALGRRRPDTDPSGLWACSQDAKDLA